MEERAVVKAKYSDANHATNEKAPQLSSGEFKNYLEQYAGEERKLSHWEMHFVNLISAALRGRDLGDADLYPAYQYFAGMFGERASRTAFRYQFAQPTA